MRIFDDAALKARRDRLSQLLNPVLNEGDVALVYCGDPVQKPGGLDQTYAFLPHPEYLWLTGLRRPHGVVAYSKGSGWNYFVLLPTVEEALWEGGGENVTGTDISELDGWLKRSGFKRVFAFGQPSLQTKESLKAQGLNENLELQLQLQELVNRARRPKDAAEVALIRRAASMAAAGYRKISGLIRPGISEREIQIEYEAEVLRVGSHKFPYDTIVGSGINGAVLHAIPTMKKVGKDELVLVDAGSDIYDYCVDITRTFSSGQYTSQQKSIYDLVLRSQTEAIAKCRPGVEWREVHTTAARVLAQGLNELKIFKCSADAAIESEAISVFLPHGVGHMVGQRVRDVGGVAGQKVKTCCGVRLRVDLPLEESFVMTVEPGLYFVQALLDRKETRERFKSEINWSEVEKWREFGGIRLEDDILVTSQEPQNLTAEVPK